MKNKILKKLTINKDILNIFCQFIDLQSNKKDIYIYQLKIDLTNNVNLTKKTLFDIQQKRSFFITKYDNMCNKHNTFLFENKGGLSV
jgi:hypothetical protein